MVDLHISLDLSILDLVHIPHGGNPVQSLKNSAENAQLADALGFARYWFAEHHGTPSQMSAAPDLLSLHTAGLTRTIRVGSGGIMLPNHSPLKVMENFSLIEALHPGRVDLGIGRAAGTDRLTSLALQRSQNAFLADDFSEQLHQLLRFFARDFSADHPFKNIVPAGDMTFVPNIFMLGSSQGGVQFAVENGLGFAFASHLAPGLAVPVLNYYRDRFIPSQFLSAPKGILAAAVITAETESEARYQAGPLELMWAKLGSGSSDITFPSLEQAASHIYSAEEEAARRRNEGRFLIGEIKRVSRRLRELAGAARVDEIMIADFYADQQSRLNGLRLLAEEFKLGS